ncbi:hypothetical protein [Peribacillus simplex]|uniref:GntT/GntP/DsdX family permease n=1 Tax=Peribacillus simplex TaxID=1478 RepID=UPI003D2B4703
MIRVATSSSTVAMTAEVGIVMPTISSIPGVILNCWSLQSVPGSLILSHVNGAGFWMIKEFC